ncbi:hypothetical protein CWO91_27950 [Bradyrhizobium genosp. SA-3]|nr:hypothetical protein CWO91_27950 [Bradyrhizobium genosp. SA-3]
MDGGLAALGKPRETRLGPREHLLVRSAHDHPVELCRLLGGEAGGGEERILVDVRDQQRRGRRDGIVDRQPVRRNGAAPFRLMAGWSPVTNGTSERFSTMTSFRRLRST